MSNVIWDKNTRIKRWKDYSLRECLRRTAVWINRERKIEGFKKCEALTSEQSLTEHSGGRTGESSCSSLLSAAIIKHWAKTI